MRITKLFREFVESERAVGLILIWVTIASLIVANSSIGEEVVHFFHHPLLGMSVEHWVNDGLMVFFFLLIGLELEREIYVGELSSWKNAVLPVVAAFGGMIVPALIHYAFNGGLPSQRGAGIPMATDIAFSLGVLSLFGNRIPFAVKVFLTALAIADDLGAILVIAIFYTKKIELTYLAGAVAVFTLLCIINRWRVNKLWPYAVGGIVMWWCLLHSGVHATLSGVLLAFAIPFFRNPDECVSHKLQHRLHFPVAFVVLPIFAFVNTCIPIANDWTSHLMDRNSLGIIFGLVIGKPLGILLFCLVAVRLRLATISDGLSWRHLTGAGLLAGIGFTMSIFVSLLAFEDEELINMSQISVLIASLIAALLGAVWIGITTRSSDADPANA